jgi:hypothetical protein
MFFQVNPQRGGVFVQYCDKDVVILFMASPNAQPKVEVLPLPKRVTHEMLASQLADLIKPLQAGADKIHHDLMANLANAFDVYGEGDDEWDVDSLTISEWDDFERFYDQSDALKAVVARLNGTDFPASEPQWSLTFPGEEWTPESAEDWTPMVWFTIHHGSVKVVEVTKGNESADVWGVWTATKQVLDENNEFVVTPYDWKFEIKDTDVSLGNGVKEVVEAIRELANRIAFGDLRD